MMMKREFGNLRSMLKVMAVVAWGAVAHAADPMNSQSSFEPGIWCSDYSAAKAYADAENVPMLVFWANPSCKYCGLLEEACRTAEFRAWQAERKFAMVFSYGDATVKKIVKNASNEYPYMMIYWLKPSGEVVMEKFTGKAGRMPAPASPDDSLQKQLMDVMDAYADGWESGADGGNGYCGGNFIVPDTDKARLEVRKDATSVLVPLIRTNGVSRIATNRMVSGSWAADVVWGKGEAKKYVAVPLSGLDIGDDVEVVLEHDGEIRDTGVVHVVAEPACSTHNPKWLGEPFDFGEWTMDLAAAREKTAKADGQAFTLVFFTGSLWCPWCLGMENHVLDTEEFRTLAKDNQISLVLLDEVKRSPYDSTSKAPYAVTTVPNGAPPSLLRYEVGSNGASGAAYLSRKGIGHEEAEAKLLTNTLLGYPGGEFCAPGAFRTGYPTFIMLDKQGNIRARFVYHSDTSNGRDENGAYFCDKDENLQRFQDFIALSANPAIVENDKFYSTTSLSHEIGTSTELKLQVCHNVNSYRLIGANSSRVTFKAVYDSANRGVTFSVVRAHKEPVARKDASGEIVGTVEVDVGSVVASAQGTLTCDFPATGEYFLRVSSFSDSGSALYGGERTETQIVFLSESEHIQTENEYFGTAFSTAFPVVKAGAIAGMVSVKSVKSNRLTVKFTDVLTGKTKSYVGKLEEPDEFGRSEAHIERNNAVIDLVVGADGKVEASLSGDAFGGEPFVGKGSVAKLNYADYAGYYTVALPVEHSSDAELEPTGSGYILLPANTSEFRKSGSVLCSVMFPNGVKASGRGTISAGENGFADLSLVVKSAKDVLTVAMSIRPNASQAPTHRAIRARDDLAARWVHSQKGAEFVRNCGVYGGYYDRKESLLDCCGTDSLTVGYETWLAAAGEQHGDIVSVAGSGARLKVSDRRIAKTVKASKFSIRAAQSSGVVSGTTTIYFSDGASVVAQFSGVILPDWRDCGCFEEDDEVPLALDIPFVYGALYFTDKVGRKTIKRSIPFGLFDTE